MKTVFAAVLALGLIVLVSCSAGSGIERSSEQLQFEKRVSAEINDHAMYINRLDVPAEAQETLAEAKDALAVAQQRMKELKETPPENWENAKVFVVIAVEKLRKAYANAKAAAEAPITTTPPTQPAK